MAGAGTRELLKSAIFHDVNGSGAYILAPWQCISWLTATQTGADATAVAGTSARVAPTTSTIEDRVTGISEGPAKHGQQFSIRGSGIAQVMVNAAVAQNSRLFVAAVAARTSAQSPILDLYELQLPQDPTVVTTYSLSLVDDTAVTSATTGSNALYCPVGFALTAATAQYQVIPVEMDTSPFYA